MRTPSPTRRHGSGDEGGSSDGSGDEGGTSGETPTTSGTNIGSIAVDDVSPVVAAEIVSSLERIRHFNAVSRGYVVCELTREVWKIACFVVDTVAEPTSPGNVEAELYIDVGVPGVRPL